MRLNAAVRREITHNATKTLYDRRVAMAKREAALAVRCYEAAFSLAIRKAIKVVVEIDHPKMRWLKFEHRLTFNVAGQTVPMTAAEAHPVPQGYYVSYTLG